MLNQQEIETILDPQHQRFNEIFDNAWNDFNKFYIETRFIFSKITRANLLRDHAVHHAKRVFARLENEGIRVIEKKNGLFVVEFSGRKIGIDGFIWTRLKKLNENLLTSNIGTKQANAFNSQKLPAFQTQPSLIGEPEKVFYPAAVNYGYTANATFTHYQGLYATLQTGRQCLGWFKKISKNDDDFGLTEVSSDPPPQTNAKIVTFPVAFEIEQPTQRRVTAKGTKNTQETENKKDKISE